MSNKKGSKRIPDNMKKRHLTIKIRTELIDDLRQIDNYNPKLEKLIEDFLKEQIDNQ